MPHRFTPAAFTVFGGADNTSESGRIAQSLSIGSKLRLKPSHMGVKSRSRVDRRLPFRAAGPSDEF